MPRKGLFSVNYVAKLLAKVAKASTIKYSPCGLDAFLPKRYTNETLHM